MRAKIYQETKRQRLFGLAVPSDPECCSASSLHPRLGKSCSCSWHIGPTLVLRVSFLPVGSVEPSCTSSQTDSAPIPSSSLGCLHWQWGPAWRHHSHLWGMLPEAILGGEVAPSWELTDSTWSYWGGFSWLLWSARLCQWWHARWHKFDLHRGSILPKTQGSHGTLPQPFANGPQHSAPQHGCLVLPFGSSQHWTSVPVVAHSEADAQLHAGWGSCLRTIAARYPHWASPESSRTTEAHITHQRWLRFFERCEFDECEKMFCNYLYMSLVSLVFFVILVSLYLLPSSMTRHKPSFIQDMEQRSQDVHRIWVLQIHICARQECEQQTLGLGEPLDDFDRQRLDRHRRTSHGPRSKKQSWVFKIVWFVDSIFCLTGLPQRPPGQNSDRLDHRTAKTWRHHVRTSDLGSHCDIYWFSGQIGTMQSHSFIHAKPVIQHW